MCLYMEGLSLSIQRTNQPILMEVDSIAVVIKMLQDIDTHRSVFALVVAEIKHLLMLCKTCITHTSRSQNEVTDHSAIWLDWKVEL